MKRNAPLLLTATWLAACAGERTVGPELPGAPSGVNAPASPSAPAPLSSPSPSTPPSAAAPTPAPPPAVTPTAPANRPPTVHLTGGGGCYPWRYDNGTVRPCTVTFQAIASDPDGDRLTYAWTGCSVASGTGLAEVICAISAIGTVSERVRVCDGAGLCAEDKAAAEGVNEVPDMSLSFPKTIPAHATYHGVGDVFDEQHCGVRDFTTQVEGACDQGGILCHSWGLDYDLRATGPGTCTFTVTFRDPWGAGVRRRGAIAVK